MISDDEAERAVDFLRDSAEKAARARSERNFADLWRDALRALLMQECNAKAVNAKKMYAEAHQRYHDHLLVIKEAVFQDELMKAEREGNKTTIEAWQTQSANLRGARV